MFHNTGTLVHEPGLLLEGGHGSRSSAYAAKCVPGMIPEDKVVERAMVWQFMVLLVAPQELDWVQFQSISWQPLDPGPPGWLLQVVPDQATAVAEQAVPYYEHIPQQVARDVTKKADHLLGMHRS